MVLIRLEHCKDGVRIYMSPHLFCSTPELVGEKYRKIPQSLMNMTRHVIRVPDLLLCTYSRAQGLFRVGPAAEFGDGDEDEDEDEDDDDDEDEEACDEPQVDDTSGVPPPVSVILGSDGKVRMNLSLCSPE